MLMLLFDLSCTWKGNKGGLPWRPANDQIVLAERKMPALQACLETRSVIKTVEEDHPSTFLPAGKGI